MSPDKLLSIAMRCAEIMWPREITCVQLRVGDAEPSPGRFRGFTFDDHRPESGRPRCVAICFDGDALRYMGRGPSVGEACADVATVLVRAADSAATGKRKELAEVDRKLAALERDRYDAGDP